MPGTWVCDTLLMEDRIDKLKKRVEPPIREKGEGAMPKALRIIYLVYGLFTILFGVPLFVVPGRLLDFFGWSPVEPLISRLLGAALLAMTWGAWRSFRAGTRAQVQIGMEANLVFTVFGAVGLFRHLVVADYYPFMVWFVFGLLVAWAVAWAAALVFWRKA
jgi:hypothetical protein